jgi:hypothetical protein
MFRTGPLPNSVLVEDLKKAYTIIDGQTNNNHNNSKSNLYFEFKFEGASNGSLDQSEFQLNNKKQFIQLQPIKRKGLKKLLNSTEESSESDESSISKESSVSEKYPVTGTLKGKLPNKQAIRVNQKKHSSKKKEKKVNASKSLKRNDKIVSKVGKDSHLVQSSTVTQCDSISPVFSSLSNLSYHESLDSGIDSVKVGSEEEMEYDETREISDSQQIINGHVLEIPWNKEEIKGDSVKNDTLEGVNKANSLGNNNSAVHSIKTRRLNSKNRTDKHSNKKKETMPKNNEKKLKKRPLVYKPNPTYMEQKFDTKMIAKVLTM